MLSEPACGGEARHARAGQRLVARPLRVLQLGAQLCRTRARVDAHRQDTRHRHGDRLGWGRRPRLSAHQAQRLAVDGDLEVRVGDEFDRTGVGVELRLQSRHQRRALLDFGQQLVGQRDSRQLVLHPLQVDPGLLDARNPDGQPVGFVARLARRDSRRSCVAALPGSDQPCLGRAALVFRRGGALLGGRLLGDGGSER